MTDNGSCIGCVMFKDGRHCPLVDVEKYKGCPCRTCLIKVMCESSCEEYDVYVNLNREAYKSF